MTVSRTAYKCILRGSVPLPFEECPRSRTRLCCNERLGECVNPSPKWSRGKNPLGRKRWVAGRSLHKCTAPEFQTFHESALNSFTAHSDATMLWRDWGDRQYVCMLVQGANKKKSYRGLCLTFWHKNMSGCTVVTVLRVCNLWYAYVPMTVC